GQVQERDRALAATRGPLTKSMLESVRAVLGSEEWSESARCPACESTPVVPPSESIKARLTQYEEVTKAQEAIRSAWKVANAPRRLSLLEASPILAVAATERRHASFDALF